MYVYVIIVIHDFKKKLDISKFVKFMNDYWSIVNVWINIKIVMKFCNRDVNDLKQKIMLNFLCFLVWYSTSGGRRQNSLQL